MKALKSNFYLIKVDDKPVYVGYTNRPIKTRFREHLHDKDFGDDEVSVEELDSLSFPFTWDITLINQYAKEVSDRETSLIAEYGTATSVWQKGVNGNIGGQTWSDIKHFVMTNKDNPKFAEMDESEILAYLDRDKVIKFYMKGFVQHIEDPVRIYLRNFMGYIDDPVNIYMHNFVNHIDDPTKIYMKSFASHIDDPVNIYMRNFVNRIDDPIKIYMHDFVHHIEDPVKVYMQSFASRIDDPVKIYMGNFVSHMQKSNESY